MADMLRKRAPYGHYGCGCSARAKSKQALHNGVEPETRHPVEFHYYD